LEIGFFQTLWQQTSCEVKNSLGISGFNFSVCHQAPLLFGESTSIYLFVTRTAKIVFPFGRNYFWFHARPWSFALRAAILLVKQLLWHFLV
jgi:hypothetical protein